MEIKGQMEALAQETRPKLYRFKRIFKKRTTLGMVTTFARTVNAKTGTIVDHFNLSCPGYVLTERGPMVEQKVEAEK